MKKLMIGITGIMAMVASVNAADTEKIKAACQSSDKTVWVEKTQACVPVNPCESGNETIRSLYCQDEESLQYAVPDGYLTPIDVINIYAKYNNLDCQVSEQNIIEKDGYVFVPCSGMNYRVFRFSQVTGWGIVTDMLCPGTAQIHEAGSPTLCYRVSSEECSQIEKRLDRKKIFVRWFKTMAHGGICQIGAYAEGYEDPWAIYP